MPNQNAYLQVWVMPVTASGLVWDASSWIIYDRLIPIEDELTVGSNGGASFRLNRKLRDDGLGDGLIIDSFVPVRGQYIAILPGGATNAGLARWIGVITEVSSVPLQGVDDEVGIVRAAEIGSILGQSPIRALSQYDPAGFNLPNQIQGIQSANITGLYQGQIIGNCVSNGTGFYFSQTFDACSADFAGSPAKFWTPLNLINRILADVVGPSGAPNTNLPPIKVSPSADVAAYVNAPIKEVVPLYGQTIGSVIDVVFGAARCLSWWVSIAPDGGSFLLNVASASSVTVGSLPAATPVTVDLKGNDIDFTLQQSGADQYDQVEVWGAPIVCCGTVSYADGTMSKGWTMGQQDAYNAGASASAGYSGLTTDQQIIANNLVRGSGVIADVYTRFIISPTVSGGSLQCRTGGGSLQNLCPSISWDGSTASIGSSAADPYLPTARINGTLPWPAGLPASGTDSRSDYQKATPSYLEPVVMAYDTSITTFGPYINLTQLPRGWSLPSPSISLDNRGLAVRIRLAPAHMLSLNVTPWDGTGTTPAVSDMTPAGGRGLNYQKILATIAVDSGQYLRVTRLRSGVTTPRNILRVQRPDLALWLVREGTILGWTGLTYTDKVSADTFTRNDYAAAQRLCDELSAWAFRARQGAEITCAISTPYTIPGWALIGNLIGTVNEYARDNSTLSEKWTFKIARTLNTPITSIRHVYGESPRIIVRTAEPAIPSTTAFVAHNSGWGGGVSVALGGDQKTAIARVDQAMRDIAKNSSTKLTVDPPPAYADKFIRLKITGGNTLLTFGGNDYKGIKEVTSGTLSALPASSPNNTTTYADGIGYGKLVDENLVEIPTSPDVWVTNYDTILPDSGVAFTKAFGYHAPNGYPCLCQRYVIGGVTVYKILR